MSGWKLSAALIGKHFGKLGDSLAEALAAFDPETATEVDRDNLADKLRSFAKKLAEARAAYAKEKKEADDLRALIEKDSKAIDILLAKAEAGEIDEAVLNAFADELEANKNRLPQEEQEAADAKELMDTYETLFKTAESQLAQFDAKAKAALSKLAQAKAVKEQQELKLKQQEELRTAANGLKSTSSALSALDKKASKLQIEADASRIMAASGEKAVKQTNAVEEARAIAAGLTANKGESAADRLRKLKG